MRKRMGIIYLNPNMEAIRQIALRNFKEIYEGIIKDLDNLRPNIPYVYEPLNDLLKKFTKMKLKYMKEDK